MRFYLDHDVPAQVCSDVLAPAGHDCWTANNAGLALEQDDDQTVYATDRGAVLVSCDSEFSQRRRRNAIGQHIYLKCPKPEAVEILALHLERILPLLNTENVTVTVTRTQVTADYGWE